MTFTLAHIDDFELSLEKTIEMFVKIYPNDLLRTKNELEVLLNDIQKVMDTVKLKKEKQIAQLKQLSFSSIKKELIEAEKRLESLKTDEDISVKEILSLHKDIKTQTNTLKAIELMKDLHENETRGFDLLLQNYEDWEFLCGFLFNIFKVGVGSEMHNYLKNFQQKTENYILQKFKDSFASLHSKILHNAFISLKELSKESLIIDFYLSKTGFLHVGNLENQELSDIEIDAYKNDRNSFCDTIKNLESIYENELVNINAIFHNDKQVFDKIHENIFFEVLIKHLNVYCTSDNPFIFLNNLSAAYEKTQTLCITIHSSCSNFEEQEYLDGLFMSLIPQTHQKEKETFDLFFDIMVKQVKPDKQYIFQSTGIFQKKFEPYKIFKILCFLLSKAKERHYLLKYKIDSLQGIEKHFIRKIIELINHIFLQDTLDNSFKKIQILSNIYIVVKQIKINTSFKELETNLTEKINVLFNSKAEDIKAQIKKTIKKFNPTEDKNLARSSMICILVLDLEKLYKDVNNYIPGRNGSIMTQRVTDFTAEVLYKEYLKHKYTVENNHFFTNDITYLISALKRLCITADLVRYEIMLEISKLLMLNSTSLFEALKEQKSRASYFEIKKILKCRSDYDQISHGCKKIFD